MKRICALFLLACVVFSVFAEGFMDYFPASKGYYWIYEDDTGSTAEAVQVSDVMGEFVFMQSATSWGSTASLLVPAGNMLVKVGFTNVWGRTIEYIKAIPLCHRRT